MRKFIAQNQLCVFCIFFAGVFGLMHAFAFVKYVQSFLTKAEFKAFFFGAIAVAASLLFIVLVGLSYTGTYPTSF